MAIVNLDKIQAGYNGNLESVVVYTTKAGTTKKADFANGLFVVLGGLLAEYGREVYKASPTVNKEVGEVLLVSSPELMYDETKKLDDFVNKKGKASRAYHLAEGDVFTFTADLLPKAVVVGNVLVADADGKLVVQETTATGLDQKITFEVIEDCGYELHIEKKAFALKVHRA